MGEDAEPRVTISLWSLVLLQPSFLQDVHFLLYWTGNDQLKTKK
jgi:hypothetical protein